jgi:hypothetical protein
MLNRLIGGFVAILIGVSLIGPVASLTTTNTNTLNSSGATCTTYTQSGCSGQGNALAISSSWAPSILNMVPGFYALGILGVGIAVTYGALADAGIV